MREARHHDSQQKALSRFAGAAVEGSQCLFCGSPVRAQGRRRKLYCDGLCRTRFHYRRRLAQQRELERRLHEADVAINAAQGILGVRAGE